MERFDLRGRRAAVATAMLALVMCSRSRPSPPSPSPCEQAFRDTRYPDAITHCGEEVARRGDEVTRRADPRAGAMLAQAYLSTGALDDAERVARRLLDGSEAGFAHRVLAEVAHLRGRYDEAIHHAELALAAHRNAKPGLRAVDAIALARAHLEQASWQAALEAADLSLQAAKADGGRSMQRAAQILRSYALAHMGATRRAEEALREVVALAGTDCEAAWTWFQGGLQSIELQRPAIARESFEAAARASPSCPHGQKFPSNTLALNLAWLDYGADELDGALARLEGIDTLSALLLRSQIAAKRGDLPTAIRHLHEASARASRDVEPDWEWERDFLMAQVIEAGASAHAAAEAERAYRRSIDQIDRLRRKSPAGDAFSVGRYRDPYDGLIALLADQGRWRDVLEVVLDLDAGDMLRSTAATPRVGSTAPPPPSPEHAARGDAPERGRPDLAHPRAVDAVIEAWRGRELVIVIATTDRAIRPGGERAYRVRVHDGHVDGAVVADAAIARLWVRDLFADLGDRAAARGLGRMVEPPTTSDRTLHVLLLGQLGKMPLAALRDERGGLVIARRALVRVLGLRPRAPRRAAVTPPVVLADPGGNLPGAAREGTAVAALLGVPLFARAAADSDRLWSAAHADVLHVAAHVDNGERGPELRLADRTVAPNEIIDRAVAPRIAVIAGCGAAAAQDDEGWGSLASAFLFAGSDVVIASDRSVEDADALALVERLYADPRWRDDPARALAAAQVALADAQLARAARRAARPHGDVWGRILTATAPATTRDDGWAAFTALVAPPEASP